MMCMSLDRYRSKRNFAKTAEPQGAATKRRRERKNDPSEVVFVIQKHAASRLHYDFRLEIEGVLKSWAVTKGVPLVKGDKNLAVQVEDHPAEYGGFEGVIPAGNYGAGTVMLWDAGICQILEGKPAEALRQGKLVFRLEGRKLRGQWTLVRMRPREDRDENGWLLIKTGDDARPISARAEDRSIQSGRTMKQIAAQQDRLWESNRKASPGRGGKSGLRTAHRSNRRQVSA